MTTSQVYEYSCAIHVHSTISDGTGEVHEIIQAGQAAELDVLILTDHNSLRAKTEGWEGWHGGLLFVVGEEVSSRRGHCLALGTKSEVNHYQSAGGIVRDIRVQNGLAFLAHPHGVYRPLLHTRDHSWKDWNVAGFTGIELWSYMFDWVSELKYHHFLRHYRNPQARIKGPFPKTVHLWDRLCQKERIVAIGGVDAHAKKYPFLPFVVFPYEYLFKTLRTHILTNEPLAEDKSEAIEASLAAMRQGNCFASYDYLHNGKGTRFFSADNNLIMGDEAEYHEPLDLVVTLPWKAHLSVVRNGVAIKRAEEKDLEFRADSPGVYRVEARLDGKPWIYTNPIYLRSTS